MIQKMFFILCMIFSSSFTVNAQEDTTKAKVISVITKNDGSEYIGEIISDDGREVLIMTDNLGKIYISKSEIKSIKEIDPEVEIVNGEFRNTGPFTTRYAFTTNALPIKKGENYALINLYGPEVHFALSDNFNLGIMSTWIASPFILAAKYSIKTKNENLNFSIGTLFGTSGYLNTFRGFGGLHFFNVTTGNRERNFTFSAGYAYIQTGFNSYYNYTPNEGTYVNSDPYFNTFNYSSFSSRPLIHGPIMSIAGITQVGKKASFIFDSMVGLFPQKGYNVVTTTIVDEFYNPNPPYDFIPGTYQHVVTNSTDYSVALFIMPGMRFQSTPNRAFQFSLAGVTYIRNGNLLAFPIPMCSWFFKF